MARKPDAKNRILKYLLEQSIDLRADELVILQRWEFADLKMREKKDTLTDIAVQISEKYHVSRWTAENDIISAQEVFGRSRKLNKKYLGHLHLERVDIALEKYRALIFREDHNPTDKEIMAYNKLLDSYTYAMNSLPTGDGHKAAISPIMIIGLIPGESISMPMALPDALKKADSIIDIEFEEIKSNGSHK